MRAGWRLTRLVVVNLLLYPTFLFGALLLAPLPARRRRWRSRIVRVWHRCVCATLAVRVRVVGEPPPAGSLLVANHLSYVDILVIGSVLETVFVSKSEVARWPGIGLLATTTGTIYVQRARKRQLGAVNEEIAAALARGDGVAVFPEGTSTRGDDVLPFRPPLLAPAADTGREVHCATLHYATAPGDPPAHMAVCWWGDMAFAPHVAGLLKLERIEATLTFHPHSVRARDRKELADEARRRVLASFRKVD